MVFFAGRFAGWEGLVEEISSGECDVSDTWVLRGGSVESCILVFVEYCEGGALEGVCVESVGGRRVGCKDVGCMV